MKLIKKHRNVFLRMMDIIIIVFQQILKYIYCLIRNYKLYFAYKYISLMKISMSAKADVPSDSLNHRTRKKGRGKPTQKENQLYQKNR